MKTITFKVLTWQEWTKDIETKVGTALSRKALSANDLIYGPKLDKEDIKAFCDAFMFEDIFENKVFVEHHSNSEYLWFINDDDTCLMSKDECPFQTPYIS